MSAPGGAAVSASPLLADIHRRLETLGLDPTARDWLIKALHPAATHECPSIPDESLAHVVLPDFRDTAVLSAPAGLTTATWDLCVVACPGDVNAFYWGSGPAGTNFTTQAAPAGYPVGSAAGVVAGQPIDWLTDITLQDTSGADRTFAVQQPLSAPFQWRPRYRGLTCYLTASALNDQGTVYAGQFPVDYQRRIPTASSAMTGPSTNFALVYPVFASAALDENVMQLLCPKPYVAPARNGVYLPHRFHRPTIPFAGLEVMRGEVGHILPGTSNIILFQEVIAGTNGVTSNRYNFIPVIPQLVGPYEATGPSGYDPSWVTTVGVLQSSVGSVMAPCDTAMGAMSTSVVIFRGLSPAASVTVRAYYGLEVIPQVDSPQRQFTRPPAHFSPLAMRAYHEISAVLDLAYPAAYNSLGALAAVIGQVAARVAPYVARALPYVGRALLAAPSAMGAASAMVDAIRRPNLSEVQRVSVSDPRVPAAAPRRKAAAPRRKKQRKVGKRR